METAINLNGEPLATQRGRPDLDWSQIRETMGMLNLSVTHIQLSMTEGNESVDTLTHSFTSMVGSVSVIAKALESLPDSEDGDQLKQTVIGYCDDVQQKMQAAIVAFQFYERLTQQLSHVSDSLTSLGNIVTDPEKLYSPFEWMALQGKIRSEYSMESEREMFDALMQGKSIADVLEARKQCTDANDDVELF